MSTVAVDVAAIVAAVIGAADVEEAVTKSALADLGHMSWVTLDLIM